MRYSGTNLPSVRPALALAGGVAFGIVIGWYRRVRLLFDPFLNALYATPRIAMVPHDHHLVRRGHLVEDLHRVHLGVLFRFW